MAAVVAVPSLGRVMEFFYRINANDPANCAFVVGALKAGHEVIGTLDSYTTIALMLAGTGNDEPTNTGYVRVVIDDADLGDPTVSGNTLIATILDQAPALTGVVAGDAFSVVWIAFDKDTAAGADSDLIPVYYSELTTDFVPNGSDVDYDFPATNLVTAQQV